MSEYLYDNDILVLSKPLARAIGLNESIVYRRIAHWLRVNAESGRRDHFRDGHWWTYNTYQGLTDDIGNIWSEKTTQRAIVCLEELGLIKSTSKYNKWKNDSTKWYTIDFEAHNAFLKLWRECGEPVCNGGHKSDEYKAFIEKWQIYLAGQDDQPVGQDVQPAGQDVQTGLDKMSRALPVSPVSPELSTQQNAAPTIQEIFEQVTRGTPEGGEDEEEYTDLEKYVLLVCDARRLTDHQRKLLNSPVTVLSDNEVKDVLSPNEAYESIPHYKQWIAEDVLPFARGLYPKPKKIARSRFIELIRNYKRWKHWTQSEVSRTKSGTEELDNFKKGIS